MIETWNNHEHGQTLKQMGALSGVLSSYLWLWYHHALEYTEYVHNKNRTGGGKLSSVQIS